MNYVQHGFTLIELIVVMVVLGVLAATALPRFVGLQGDARIAKIKGASGAAKSAAMLAHAASLVKGYASSTSVSMEGAVITMANFYPTANASGIMNAAQISTNDEYGTSGGGTAAGSILTITVSDATTPANCSFTYTNPAVSGNAPTFGAPVTSGC